MRNIPEGFKEHLEAGVTTVCRCWKIERTDGVVLGFTDHDNDLSFDGVHFKATTGLTASALDTAVGASVDNAAVIGALNSEGITETDIQAGRYDRAEVWLWYVNWQSLEDRVVMFRGWIGEVSRGDTGFEAELRGLTDALNQPVGKRYMRQCNAQLGDARCGVDISAPEYCAKVTVSRVVSELALEIPANGYDDNWFQSGRVEWTSGTNAGTKGFIVSDRLLGANREITLEVPPGLQVEVGDALTVIAGCDKRLENCGAKFANITNFQGFPFIPGEDWAYAYPVRGGANVTSE